MKSGPALIGHLLTRHELLRSWRAENRAQSQLLKRVTTHLPEEVRPHCVNVRIDDDILVLFADSSAWATRIRYGLQNILLELGVRKVRVRVAPPTVESTKYQKSSRGLPRETSELLRNTAKTVKDPELKRVLARLAAHGGAASKK